jgi:hypothetical protein
LVTEEILYRLTMGKSGSGAKLGRREGREGADFISWAALHQTLEGHKGKAGGIENNLVTLLLQVTNNLEHSKQPYPQSAQQLCDVLLVHPSPPAASRGNHRGPQYVSGIEDSRKRVHSLSALEMGLAEDKRR